MPKNLLNIKKYANKNNLNANDVQLVNAHSNIDVQENFYMDRLQEMVDLNSHLEAIIGEKTKELIELAETNSKFISIIAHDLRSPFTSIIGVLELLKTSLKSYSKNETELFLNLASSSAEKTLKLLDSLLIWAIAQNKERSFNPKIVNLQELVIEEIGNYNFEASQKKITLNYFIDHDLSVIVDLQMIKTVFRNLISNAIKFTNTGGSIEILAKKDKLHINIIIKDNGIGISSEAQKNLFRAYELYSTEGTKHEKGAGLGLLLCKEFVEMHEGSIQTKSEAGQGCEFIISLPLVYQNKFEHRDI